MGMNEVAERLRELELEIKKAAESESWAVRRIELDLAADHVNTAFHLTVETSEGDER